MRKKLFILLTIAMLGMNSVWAESYTGCVIVEHNGEETFFGAKDIQLAFDTAVDGDVIHISDGEFPRDVTVKSLVKIKSTTWLHYTIEIPGNPSIDEPFIESNYNFQLIVNCNLQNIVFSQAYINTFIIQKGFTVDNVSFDRCYFWVNNYGELKNIKANNCIVNRIYNSPDATIQSGDFIYCNIGDNCLDVTNAKYVNSIFLNCENCGPFTFDDNCTFERCLISSNVWVIDPSQKTNCWDIDPETFSEDSDYLLANGYVDADGKVIGCQGGATPYGSWGQTSGPSIWNNPKKQGNKLSVEMHIND